MTRKRKELIQNKRDLTKRNDMHADCTRRRKVKIEMKRLMKRDILSEGKGRELVLIKYKSTNLEVSKIFCNVIKKLLLQIHHENNTCA